MDITLPEIEEAEDMVSLRRNVTGVDATVFVSTKGYGQHAPACIRIAVGDRASLNAVTAGLASMAIRDCALTGAAPPPHIVEQAKQYSTHHGPSLSQTSAVRQSTPVTFRRRASAADRLRSSHSLCPNCQALYQIVKVEAGPETIDREPTCRACGGPLAGRDGKFVLKYFLLRKAARIWRRP